MTLEERVTLLFDSLEFSSIVLGCQLYLESKGERELIRFVKEYKPRDFQAIPSICILTEHNNIASGGKRFVTVYRDMNFYYEKGYFIDLTGKKKKE